MNPPQENINEQHAETHKQDSELRVLSRRISTLETHVINLCSMMQYVPQFVDMLKKPLKIDQSELEVTIQCLEYTLTQMLETILEFKKISDESGVKRTVGEIQFIGKKLHEIEGLIAKIEKEGFKKKITLDVSCDGYEMVKKKIFSQEPEDGIKKLLDCLSRQEADVLSSRFGLLGQKRLTLKQIGEQLGVSRDRVSQIQAKALRKCRHYSRAALAKKITHKELREAIGYFDQDETENSVE